MLNDGIALGRCERCFIMVQVLLGTLILLGERLSIGMLGDVPLSLWVSLSVDERRLEPEDEPRVDEPRLSPDWAPLDDEELIL